MALTTIKTGGLADNSVTDAKVADAITVTGAQTGITSVGTLTSFRSTGIDDNADALAVTIDSSENIGIGVTNPSSFDDEAEKLVVGTGSGNQGMTIYAGTSSRAKIHFADGASGTSAYRGMVSYDHNGDSMSFATSNTTALTLDSSQNATFAGNITTAGGMIITQADGSNTDAYFGLGNDADYGQIGANEIGLWNVNNNDIIFGTNNNLRMTIQNDGKVGIGCTPDEMLHVASDSKFGGNIKIATNGKGIDFSASSNNSGMTSELLDDYEEGTFQPVMEGSTNQGSFTYVAQVGRYTKIGRMVQIQIYINISACLSVPSGSYMFIRGLPFTNSNDAGVSEGATFSMNYWTLESSVGTPAGFVFRNNSSVLLTHSNASGGASVGILTPSDWATSATSMGRNIYGSATYYVD